MHSGKNELTRMLRTRPVVVYGLDGEAWGCYMHGPMRCLALSVLALLSPDTDTSDISHSKNISTQRNNNVAFCRSHSVYTCDPPKRQASRTLTHYGGRGDAQAAWYGPTSPSHPLY
jgi:hypothetical protein